MDYMSLEELKALEMILVNAKTYLGTYKGEQPWKDKLSDLTDDVHERVDAIAGVRAEYCAD